MNVITKPTVEIIAATQFLGHPTYQVPVDGDDATKTSSFAAKGCYDSFGTDGRSNEENQKHIIRSRHGSVLEHVSVSLFITGITRACSLEVNRHRHLAISQRSTRYTAEEDCAIVLDPYYAEIYERPFLSDSERVLMRAHLEAANNAVRQYQFEVETLVSLNPKRLSGTELRKWARGKARNILPHALETRGTWTGNLRAWRHFVETRTDRHAEAEIRRLAAAVADVLVSWAPLYFEDYKFEMIDGLPELRTEYRKI